MDRQDDFFRDLCDNAHDLIQSVSAEGKFLYVNRSWLATLGYRLEEVDALSLFDIIHPDSLEHCRVVMRELISGRPAIDITAEFRAKDGRSIPVEGSASARFEGRRLVSTRGIFRDVTQRRRAEQDLDNLFNLSLDLLCIAGMDGFFKRINPAFEKLLGHSRQQLLSKSFLQFVHPEDRARTVEEVTHLAHGLPVVDFSNRYRARDGTYHWLDWRAAPLPSRGLIYAVARDVTEHRRIQDLINRQAAELARSNAALEQFAYAASHDLRAPLRAITTLTGWIEEKLGPDRGDEVGGHLAQLRSRAQRMELLTDDLLKYARAGRVHSEVASVDTAALVDEAVFLLGPREGLRVVVEPGMPVLETARAPLEQILRNLIGNALKYHDRPEGRVVVSARDQGELVEFSVEDDGPGIPEEFRSRLFKMFQKLESRDRVEGNGIGLALVKRLVESHGGQVWLDPATGRGATFRFTWPRRLDAAAEPLDVIAGARDEAQRADDPGR